MHACRTAQGWVSEEVTGLLSVLAAVLALFLLSLPFYVYHLAQAMK